MRYLVISAVLSALAIPTASAQAPVQWMSDAKIINGKCNGGAVAEITETPGKMNVRTSFKGKTLTSFEVALAADGSGKANTSGELGRMIFEIPAGVGKRGMKNSEVDGTCQWQWIPR